MMKKPEELTTEELARIIGKIIFAGALIHKEISSSTLLRPVKSPKQEPRIKQNAILAFRKMEEIVDELLDPLYHEKFFIDRTNRWTDELSEIYSHARKHKSSEETLRKAIHEWIENNHALKNFLALRAAMEEYNRSGGSLESEQARQAVTQTIRQVEEALSRNGHQEIYDHGGAMDSALTRAQHILGYGEGFSRTNLIAFSGRDVPP